MNPNLFREPNYDWLVDRIEEGDCMHLTLGERCERVFFQLPRVLALQAQEYARLNRRPENISVTGDGDKIVIKRAEFRGDPASVTVVTRHDDTSLRVVSDNKRVEIIPITRRDSITLRNVEAVAQRIIDPVLFSELTAVERLAAEAPSSDGVSPRVTKAVVAR